MGWRESCDLVDQLENRFGTSLQAALWEWDQRYAWSDLVGMLTFNALIGKDALLLPPLHPPSDRAHEQLPKPTSEEHAHAHELLAATTIYTP